MRHTLNVCLQSHGKHTRFNFESVIFLNEGGIGKVRAREGAKNTDTLHLGNEVQNFCTYCLVNRFHNFPHFV
jgi:hypothetical protein